jgi:hypothetical protein
MRIGIRGLLRPVAASLAILTVGCGTTYSPREPGRIYFAISRQDEILVKDGKKFSLSAFSGDLAEAVSGNPAAEKHARTYVRRQRIAGVLGGLGLAAILERDTAAQGADAVVGDAGKKAVAEPR